MTFLISDFLARDYEKPLRLVGRKHDLVPVVIADPLEVQFPKMGLVEMEDPETGERFVVDTSDPRVRGRFARAMQAQRAGAPAPVQEAGAGPRGAARRR